MTDHAERLAATSFFADAGRDAVDRLAAAGMERELRRGDVLLKLVVKGRHTELRSVEQLNGLLAGLKRDAVITLQVRRGESTAFVTVTGLADKG